ncbi:geranyl-CoA carboxylase alpha subunit [Paraburkholderia unamae]|uniref:acetyl/propionyl/methylcrotonyl-CoA carboxylase subunit alpha n=1 Tax=Paraburkholderia unamae TaxID=219649 RepID=UPI000DC4F669|nr:geranyl-CoA carboxylase alpha subunit [Paraburkholderia unamae]
MNCMQRLLVANRGEIALRVMRTAHALGIETVAVYSDADALSPHVSAATRAVRIGPAPASASYLDIDAVIRAARLAGADAVHPGYGFLSENAAFAQACLDAGLNFVGPSPQAIAAMGDKAQAKRFMAEAGLPCVPGYDGEAQDDASLEAAAARIGYPVIIKATAGGGGRGMRVVDHAQGFARALESARSEARSAFGSDRMLVERVVRDPRHIEIQVLTDRHGNGVYLGERDCSVQRRHQKLIEEAPAPLLGAGVREQMGRAAVAAALALGYEGVGTFEFLLDGAGAFYFMEMNTRLQVEHPVTECIAGIDLVEWQLRVAMGEPLGFAQEDVELAGHAIEVRLCAEDEHAGFMPQSGTIARWRAPQGIRVEHAVASGAEISPYYDSMFAKLIASGRNREDARRKLIKALRETVVFGIRTNRQALIRCLAHPAFVAGGVSTAFLREHESALLPPPEAGAELARALAAALLCHGEAGATAGGTARGAIVDLALEGGATHRLTVSAGTQGEACVTGGETPLALRLHSVSPERVCFGFDGVEREAQWLKDGERLHLQFEGDAWTFIDRTYAQAQASDEAEDGRLRAPSNGRIVALYVSTGEAVSEGQALLVIEAMKMEHTVTARAPGTVANIHASAGDSVTTGKLLIEMASAA